MTTGDQDSDASRAVSDIPEDGKYIMPKRVGCARILIDGAWFLKF